MNLNFSCSAKSIAWWILAFAVHCLPGTLSNETVYLESYPSYSVVLPVSHETARNETFLVQSPRFHRVMAVIQFLNIPPKNDFSCGVFLQFQDGADQRSAKICGNFDPDEKTFSPSSLVGPRTYLSSRNSLRVSLLHVTTGKLENSYARISFTAFRDDCYFLQPRGNNTGSGVSYPRYRPCEYAISSDGIGRQCIVSALFCDNVIHCAPTDEKSGTDFGQDESELNCPHIYHQHQSIILPTVTDAALPSSQKENEPEKRGHSNNNQDDKIFKRFFDEREEHLANLFKSAIIGFVGICTICILVAFVISIFCWRQKQYHLEHRSPQS